MANRAAVSSTIIGATKIQQLEDNLASLDFAIPADLLRHLDEISAPELFYPYNFFQGEFTKMVTGGTTVRRAADQQAA